MKNKTFAILIVAIQLMCATLILSSGHPSVHWLCIFNVITALMIIYKYLTDDE